MYHEATKQEYIATLDGNKINIARRLFTKSEAVEQKYGKDLADFDRSEALDLYKSFGAKAGILSQYRSVLVSYADRYCKGINYYTLITLTELNNLADGDEYFEIEDFREFIESIPNECDKAVFWLLFEGVTADEIDNIQRGDLSRDGILKLQNLKGETRTIQISEEEAYLVRKGIKQTQYVPYDNNSYVECFPLDDSQPKLLKRRKQSLSKDTGYSARYLIGSRCKSISKHTGVGVNINLIRRSGVIHYLETEGADFVADRFQMPVRSLRFKYKEILK